jgi:hypothetical protein
MFGTLVMAAVKFMGCLVTRAFAFALPGTTTRPVNIFVVVSVPMSMLVLS